MRLGSPRPHRDLFGRVTSTPRRSGREVQKPPKSNSYNSEGQRPRESWWRAASLDDLRREQGVRPSTSLCSKQAGTTGNSTGPEEAKAKALAEDHGPVLTSRPQRRTIAEPRGKANQESTEECRFFRDPPRQRSSAQNFWKEVPAAGAASAHNRRFDTPAGTAALMGRARSQTPDYHRRYASNAVGSSLPGCQLTQGSGPCESPSCSQPRRSFILTPARSSEVACRFNRTDGQWLPCRRTPGKQAYALSSSRACSEDSGPRHLFHRSVPS